MVSVKHTEVKALLTHVSPFSTFRDYRRTRMIYFIYSPQILERRTVVEDINIGLKLYHLFTIEF